MWGVSRDVLERLTTVGGGAVPPLDPDFIVGKNEILQTELLIWAIFGTQIFGSQTPPPSPSSHPWCGGLV